VVRFAAWIFVLTGCALAARDGQFLCPDERCPAGFACVEGVCRSATDAAGGLDAPLPDVPGLDAPRPDVPGLDAPSVDGGEPFSCPDAPTATDAGPDAPVLLDAPGPAESCVPDARLGARDENGDGRIDEGCGYFFRGPHMVLSAMPTVGSYLGVDLTADGTTLVTASGELDAPVYFARRPSLVDAFAVAEPEPGLALAGRRIESVTIRGDGAELIVAASGADGTSRLYRSVACAAGWPALTPIGELDGASPGESEPYLRRDGLELLFVRRSASGGVPTILRARRTDLGAPWVTESGGIMGSAPTMSFDGHTLYYSESTGGIRVSDRTGLDVAFAPASTGSPTLAHPTSARAMRRLVILPAAREAYFSHFTDGTTVPSDAPLARSVFRMQVCRNAACGATVLTSCVGFMSADGLTCYRAPSTVSAYPAVPCAPDQRPLAIHSRQETDLIRGRFPLAWLGMHGRRWDNGQPFLYDEFSVEPSAMECASVEMGWPLDPDCVATVAGGRTVLCERELWPVYVRP
jgi:hypothetical protein